MKHTEGPWRKGIGNTVVSDEPIPDGVLGTNEPYHYDGYLIAESIADRNIPLIAAAPQLRIALHRSDCLIREAQGVISRFLCPEENLSAGDIIARLIHLFDGPYQRSVQEQTIAALQKANGE